VQHLHEVLLEVAHVIKADALTGDATAAGTEMRQLRTGGGAENVRPAETSEVELREIRS